MAVVLLEVVLPGAGHQGMPRQDRRLGRGHRGVRWRHAAGPIVPLQDHRGPSPQPLQVLHMSGTSLFSTHTTYTDRPPRRSRLRRTLRRRALPTRCTTVDRLAATDDKKVKALTLGSDLGDTILTQLRPRHRLAYPTFLITILSFPPTPTATTDPRLTVSADARALSHDLTELQVLHPV